MKGGLKRSHRVFTTSSLTRQGKGPSMANNQTDGSFLERLTGNRRNLLAAGGATGVAIALIAVAALAFGGGSNARTTAFGPPQVFIPAQAEGDRPSGAGVIADPSSESNENQAPIASTAPVPDQEESTAPTVLGTTVQPTTTTAPAPATTTTRAPATTTTTPALTTTTAPTTTTVAPTTTTTTAGGSTVAVPNIVGLSLGRAILDLEDIGLTDNGNRICGDNNQVNNVLSQSPAPGTLVAVGTAVNFDYQWNSVCAPVPDMVGLTEDAARNAWNAGGFVPTSFSVGKTDCAAGYGAGVVYWHTPLAAELLPVLFGHTIMWVSNGCP